MCIKFTTLPPHIVYLYTLLAHNVYELDLSASKCKGLKAFILIPGLELIKYTKIVYLLGQILFHIYLHFISSWLFKW
jgi:hypothetical protein